MKSLGNTYHLQGQKSARPMAMSPAQEQEEPWTFQHSERAAAAAAIGELKAKNGTPIYEPQREQDVLQHVRKSNPGPLTDLQVQHIYERLMDVMRELQRPHGSAGKH
jgi:chorismate mutase